MGNPDEWTILKTFAALNPRYILKSGFYNYLEAPAEQHFCGQRVMQNLRQIGLQVSVLRVADPADGVTAVVKGLVAGAAAAAGEGYGAA